MVLGLVRGASLPHLRTNASTTALLGAAAPKVASGRAQHPAELLPHRRESTYEPCEPSTSSMADFGARVTLERLYSWNGLSEDPVGAFLVTVDDRPQQMRRQGRSEDYFANLGDAIRSLREDIPLLFQKELNYDIYREDVVFRDPRNCFKGIKNYKLIFWSLRFHGRLFFQRLYVEVQRIWQPEDGVIKMRWTVHGIPRVPWEAEGTFDGISTYRLDSHGKIYEHSVDNILLRDPPMITNPPLLAGLNLQPLVTQQQPVPGAWCQSAEPDKRWGAVVQRVVASALHSLDLDLDSAGQHEQEPAAAVAAMPGLPAMAGLPMSAHTRLPHPVPHAHGAVAQQPHAAKTVSGRARPGVRGDGGPAGRPGKGAARGGADGGS